MQFVSLSFLVFLPVVWLVVRLAGPAHKRALLLLSSLLFVGWISLGALAVLLFFSLLTFYGGLALSSASSFRKQLFIGLVLLQAASLLLLKYVESGNAGLHLLFHEAGYRADLILFAAGFSFYALQHIAYLSAVYHRRTVAEQSPFNFLLFSAFFPKFQSGPLEEAPQLIAQFQTGNARPDQLQAGVHRIILGIFKKMVLADRLAPIVGRVFSSGQVSGSGATAAGVCLFTVQLYFDFSAYSDIAIGTGKLFGIELTENFNFPFRATSVSDFWRRWHISLINWFGKQVFNPVAYRLRRFGVMAILGGVWATFLLSGLWHGIGMTFLIWSLLHALYLSFETLTKYKRLGWSQRFPVWLYTFWSTTITFLLVCFSNLFFRSADLSEALQLLRQLMTTPFGGKGLIAGFLSVLAGGGYQEALFNLGVTGILVLLFLILEKSLLQRILSGKGVWLQSFALLLLVFVFGIFAHSDYFIYLQF